MTGMLVAQASRASASAGRIHEILSTEAAVVDPPNPVALPAGGTGELRLRRRELRDTGRARRCSTVST